LLKYEVERRSALIHEVQPSGPIPTVGDAEGIYPYVSFCETARRPILRSLKFIIIENEQLRVAICPDLGGKIHSIVEKKSGKEVLFDSGAVKPVRILPRMGFISGGIEVSFPISHSPVQLEQVEYEIRQTGERIYVWCGERELRSGMHWTVEYSLGEEDAYLTQRTLFNNPTSGCHSWMSWSNAAVPARPDSEFHFPSGSVLYHGNTLGEMDWEQEQTYRLQDFDRMLGFFWKTADCGAFGVYTPSLGCGLYHVADRRQVPGIKLWIYGTGKHEPWAHLTAIRKESYIEIQAGPLKEQADLGKLLPGERHCHVEYWIPTSKPLLIREIPLPQAELIDVSEIPLFKWAGREKTMPWLHVIDAFSRQDPKRIPTPPAIEELYWPPSGMEELDEALLWAAEHTDKADCSLWSYYRGVWLAGTDRIDVALQTLALLRTDWASAFKCRLYRVFKNDMEAARVSLSEIRSEAWSNHPQIVVERDIVLSHFGHEAIAERRHWLDQVNALDDDGITERNAFLLHDEGRIEEARQLLSDTRFEKVHQRYVRSELWRQVQDQDPTSSNPPENLGEDDLATYGAYRVFDDNGTS
jgi:hypothetical protein